MNMEPMNATRFNQPLGRTADEMYVHKRTFGLGVSMCAGKVVLCRGAISGTDVTHVHISVGSFFQELKPSRVVMIAFGKKSCQEFLKAGSKNSCSAEIV